MSEYETRVYESEPAAISRDGKQVRIYKRTEDRYRLDETTELLTIDLEKAKDLHQSLGETIQRMEQ